MLLTFNKIKNMSVEIEHIGPQRQTTKLTGAWLRPCQLVFLSGSFRNREPFISIPSEIVWTPSDITRVKCSKCLSSLSFNNIVG